MLFGVLKSNDRFGFKGIRIVQRYTLYSHLLYLMLAKNG